jgi:hypothetical protein
VGQPTPAPGSLSPPRQPATGDAGEPQRGAGRGDAWDNE